MRTSTRRRCSLAGLAASALAACNAILGNQNGEVYSPPQDASVIIVEGPDAAAPPPRDPPVEPTGCHLPRQGGVFTACSGATCPPVETGVVGSYDRLHAVPGGVIVRGGAATQVIEDPGTGAEPVARGANIPVGRDLIADYGYFYTTAQDGEQFSVTRYRRDDGTPAGALPVPKEAVGLGAGKLGGGEPWLALGHAGHSLGLVRRTSDSRFNFVQILIDWTRPTPAFTVPSFLDSVTYDPGSAHAVYGALALGRTRSGEGVDGGGSTEPDRVEVLYNAPAVATVNGWQTLATESVLNPSGGYAAIYANASAVAGCDGATVLASRWDYGLELFRLGLDGDGGTTITHSSLPPDPARYQPSLYRGDRDEKYVYYAPTKGNGAPAAVPDDPSIYVFDATTLALVTVLPTGSPVTQVAVSDCWLFWLDTQGKLFQLAKPGCHA